VTVPFIPARMKKQKNVCCTGFVRIPRMSLPHIMTTCGINTSIDEARHGKAFMGLPERYFGK
jgi:hypothetical protein